MTESGDREFGDRLAAMEPMTPALREQYDAKMHALLNATQSPQQRWGGLLFIAFYGVLLIVILVQPAARQSLFIEMWPLGTVALAGGAVFAVLTAYRTARRSVHELHDAPYLEAANVLIITVFAVAMFGVAIGIDDFDTDAVGRSRVGERETWVPPPVVREKTMSGHDGRLPSSASVRTGLIGLSVLLLVVATVCAVGIVIRWHSTRTRLALLELEATIAQLSEVLERQRTTDGHDRTS